MNNNESILHIPDKDIGCFVVEEAERGLAVVHQFRNNGYNIVLDVNSGSVHVVDDMVYDVIALLNEQTKEEEIISSLKDKYSVSDLREALEECNELKDAGALFTEDIYLSLIHI